MRKILVYVIFDIVEFFVGIAVLIASAITIYIAVVNRRIVILIAILTMGLFLFLLILKILKLKKVLSYSTREFAQNCHRINHLVRDEISELNKLQKNGKITEMILQSKIQKVGKEAVNMLSEMLSNFSGYNIRANIKWLPNPNKIIKELKEWEDVYFETLCRSENSMIFADDKRDKIFNSTALTEIAVNGKTEFSQLDLIKFEKQLAVVNIKYRNTNPDWKKHYASLIVVPIRYKPENDVHDLLGFLCLDAFSKSAIRKEWQKMFEEFAKTFADALYILFDKISIYSLNLKRK
jgi:hypothetical protein